MSFIKNKTRQKRYLIVSLILFAVAVGTLIFLAFYSSFQGITLPPSTPSITSRSSAFSWRPESPHWLDENGEPYLKTADVVFDVKDSDIARVFGESSELVKSQLRKWSAWQNDLVVNNFWVDKTVNPSVQAIYQGNWVHKVDVNSNFWNYLSSLFSGKEFEDLFLHRAYDTDQNFRDACGNVVTIKGWNPYDDKNGNYIIDNNETHSDPRRTATSKDQSRQRPLGVCYSAERQYYLLNYFNVQLKSAVINYWTGQSYGGYQAIQNADGVFWDSGVLWIDDGYGFPKDTLEVESQTPVEDGWRKYYTRWLDFYGYFLAELKYILNTRMQKKVVLNSADFFPNDLTNGQYYFASGTDISQNEHFDAHEWTSHIYQQITLLNQTRLRWLSSEYPELELITQNGGYREVDDYSDWYGCSSRELAQRIQMASLSAHYISAVKDYKTYYRESGEGCGFTTVPNGGSGIVSWLYNAVGRLSRAVAYNVGQPIDNQIITRKTFRYNDLDPYPGGGRDPVVKEVDGVVYQRKYAHADVFYRPPRYGLNYYRNINNNDYTSQAKEYLHERSILKADGTSEADVPLESKKCLLGYDGSIRGPFSSIVLYKRDGAIAVDCGLKVESFDLSQVDLKKSSSTWWEETLTDKKTFITYQPLAVGDDGNGMLQNEIFQDNTFRPALIALMKNNIKVQFLDLINLNPAQTVDLDDEENIFFDHRSNRARFGIKNHSLLSGFKKKVRITVSNLSLTNPLILKNDRVCSADCTILSYQNGQLVFEDSSFGGYEIVETSGRGGDGGSGGGGGSGNGGGGSGSGGGTVTPPGGGSGGSVGGGSTGSNRSGRGTRSGGGSTNQGHLTRNDYLTPTATSYSPSPTAQPTRGRTDGTLPDVEPKEGLFKASYLWSSLAGLLVVIGLIVLTLAYRRVLKRKLRQQRDRQLIEN